MTWFLHSRFGRKASTVSDLTAHCALNTKLNSTGLVYRTIHETHPTGSAALGELKIWACRLCNGRLSGRGAWLLFIHLLTCIMCLFVAVRIHYNFSYLILRQHSSPFHTWNLTFHCETNETRTLSLNQNSTGLLKSVSQPSVKLHSRQASLDFMTQTFSFRLLNARLRYFWRLMTLMHSWLIRVSVRQEWSVYVLATQRRHWELIQCWNVHRLFCSTY